MPGFDKTGPEGKGPRTGRGMGACNPNSPKNPAFPKGRGLGRGRGRLFGRGFGPSSANEEK